MNKVILRRYAQLRKKREEIEEQLNTLGTMIIGSLQKDGLTKVESEHGEFTLISVPRWNYSESLLTKEVQLKKEKEQERLNGIANSQVTTSLRFQF